MASASTVQGTCLKATGKERDSFHGVIFICSLKMRKKILDGTGACLEDPPQLPGNWKLDVVGVALGEQCFLSFVSCIVLIFSTNKPLRKEKSTVWHVGLDVRRPTCESSLYHTGMSRRF